MAGFDLSNYKTVPERIAEAKALYPEGRFQSDIYPLPDPFRDKFIAVRAMFFRTPDDPTPASGLAWEAVPGKTPYTKDSELMNAETSAWGRALIAAFAADASKGIASREEVQNRQPEPRPRSGGRKLTPTPPSSENHEDAPRTNGTGAVATTTTILKRELLAACSGDKAKAGMIWREAVGQFGFTADDQIPDDMREVIGAALKVRESVS